MRHVVTGGNPYVTAACLFSEVDSGRHAFMCVFTLGSHTYLGSGCSFIPILKSRAPKFRVGRNLLEGHAPNHYLTEPLPELSDQIGPID